MSQITILDQANTPMGPFTRAQVAEKLQRGEVTLKNLAFVEGLSQWTPLGEVLARVDAANPPAVPAPAVAAPAPAPVVIAPPGATLGYSYAATMAPPGHLVYAGFWLRFVAIIIDGIVLSPLVIISFVIQGAMRGASDTSSAIALGMVTMVYGLIAFVVRWLYFAMLESGPWQATLGKKALGLRVTGMDGQRIGFGRATGRYFGKILSGIILCIGFMMAGWTARKQALHDMIANTLVVRG